MRMCVWKYELKGHGKMTINVPAGSRFLKMGLQNGKVVVWFEVFPDGNKENTWVFYEFTTGEEVPMWLSSHYIDTLLLSKGNYILHFYGYPVA